MILEAKDKNKEENQQIKTIHIDFSVEEYKKFTHTHLLGNYHIYAQQNPNQKWNNSRINVLSSSYFINKVVLDIGCNEGVLTIPIALKYHPQFIKGIDIDEKLIKKCKQNVDKFVKENKSYQQDHELVEEIQKLPAYFLQKLQGSTKIYTELKKNVQFVSKQTSHLNTFPKNIDFKLQNGLLSSDSQFYDCILCMNITKWIHLTFGDEGIKKLFENIGNKLHEGGILILESQPWKSYRKKLNLSPIYKSNYNKIFFKPQKFPLFLKTLGIQEVQTIEPSEQNKIKHRIMIFQKKGFYSDD